MSASQRTIESFFMSNAVEDKNTCIVERKRAATGVDRQWLDDSHGFCTVVRQKGDTDTNIAVLS